MLWAVERSFPGVLALTTLAPRSSCYLRQKCGVSLVFNFAAGWAIQRRSSVSAFSVEHCWSGNMNQF